MEYLTVENVYSEVKSIEPSTKITDAIKLYIEEEEAILNGILATRYKLPIEETEATVPARRILRAAVLYKVLTRLEIYFNLGNNTEDGQAIVDKVTYWSMNKNLMSKIEKNTVKLEGVPLIENYVASSFPESKFNRGRSQW